MKLTLGVILPKQPIGFQPPAPSVGGGQLLVEMLSAEHSVKTGVSAISGVAGGDGGREPAESSPGV
jgi:hypothetical protein